MERYYLNTEEFKLIRNVIEDTAIEHGFKDCNILVYAIENNMLFVDQFNGVFITEIDLQKIASEFTELNIRLI